MIIFWYIKKFLDDKSKNGEENTMAIETIEFIIESMKKGGARRKSKNAKRSRSKSRKSRKQRKSNKNRRTKYYKK